MSLVTDPGRDPQRNTNAPIDFGDEDTLVREDRRESERQITLFRPCCIENGDLAQLGLIRNMSESGALIETGMDLRRGDEIRYFWDSLPAIEARVAWRKDNKVGVQNIRRGGHAHPAHPHRSVRVPCNKPARVWIGGEARECWVINISLTGMLLFGLDDRPKGTPLSIKLGSKEFENADVRWSDLGSTGVRFAKPLSPRDLMRLLA